MRYGLAILAMLFAASFAGGAKALEVSDDLVISGYGDLRAVATDAPPNWLEGGLGKFRYGGNQKFGTEAVAQADLTLDDGLHAVGLFRAEPETRSVVDALEMYLRYAPQSHGDVSWSMKAGAFFPTISLENDDLGWTSPYTLTPSAINSWIGEELRTIGSEGTLHWNTHAIGDRGALLLQRRDWHADRRPGLGDGRQSHRPVRTGACSRYDVADLPCAGARQYRHVQRD
jgi:hypothetical protein